MGAPWPSSASSTHTPWKQWCPAISSASSHTASTRTIVVETGLLLGAVGISDETSDNDAVAAVAGIEAVGLTRTPELNHGNAGTPRGRDGARWSGRRTPWPSVRPRRPTPQGLTLSLAGALCRAPHWTNGGAARPTRQVPAR